MHNRIGNVRGARAISTLLLASARWRIYWGPRPYTWRIRIRWCSTRSRSESTRGARIGIVGRNGDGKSSLLQLLTGQLQPHSGRVTHRSGLRVCALSQADTLDDDRTVGWTLVGDQPEHQWAGDPRVRDVVSGLVSDIAGTQRFPRSAVASVDGCSWPDC